MGKGRALLEGARRFHTNQWGAAGDQPEEGADDPGAKGEPGEPGADPDGAKSGKSAEELQAELDETKNRLSGSTRTVTNLLKHAGAQNADEFLGRQFGQPAAAQPKTTEPEWTPNMGEPEKPDETDPGYERDEMDDLTPAARRRFKADDKRYDRNMAKFVRWEERNEDNKEAFPKNLADAIAEVPPQFAPDDEAKAKLAEAVRSLATTRANGGCPTKAQIVEVRELMLGLMRASHGAQLKASDDEADANRKVEPPQLGTVKSGTVSQPEPSPLDTPASGPKDLRRKVAELADQAIAGRGR